MKLYRYGMVKERSIVCIFLFAQCILFIDFVNLDIIQLFIEYRQHHN